MADHAALPGPPPLACLSPRSLPPGYSSGVGRGSGRSPRRPRAPHAHLREPPHLQRHHKVSASSERSEMGCAPGRLGASSSPCPAPRPPAPHGARGAQLRGVRERGRSSPLRPHPHCLFLLLGHRLLTRLSPLSRLPSPLLAVPPPEPRLFPRPQPLSPQTFRQDGGPEAGLPYPHVTTFSALSTNGK